MHRVWSTEFPTVAIWHLQYRLENRFERIRCRNNNKKNCCTLQQRKEIHHLKITHAIIIFEQKNSKECSPFRPDFTFQSLTFEYSLTGANISLDAEFNGGVVLGIIRIVDDASFILLRSVLKNRVTCENEFIDFEKCNSN